MGHVEDRPCKSGFSKRAIVKFNGQTYRQTFKGPNEAKIKAEAWRWVEEIETALKTGTLREYITLQDLFVYLTEQGKQWSRDHQSDIALVVREAGEFCIYDMTPTWVEALLFKWSTEPRQVGAKPNSPTTCRKKFYILSMLLQSAVKRGLLKENPCHRVDPPKANKGRVRFLSESERTRLLAACRESKQPLLYPLVVLALCTGARLGELLKLRWKDVDLNTGRLVFWDTKNGTHRGLVLPGEIVQFLIKMKDENVSEKARVFPAKMRDAWNLARDKAKLEDFRFHDTRHTTASMLLMQGRTLPEISGVLGHLSAASTKRYAHLDVAHTKQVLQGMAGWVLG